MKILGLIPARGGSKGVPRKNIRLIAGKPLIQYSIEVAISSGCFAHIFVSTEDNEIADVSRNLGAEVPILRPAVLAQDTTPTLPVIEHVLDYFESIHVYFDAVCLLQPTCPLRTKDQIAGAINSFLDQKVDSLVSVIEIPHKYHPYISHFKGNDGLLKPVCSNAPTRRQDMPKAYVRDGSIYIFKRNTIRKFGNIYGERVGYYLMTDESINIDSMNDYYKAEALLNQRLNNGNQPI